MIELLLLLLIVSSIGIFVLLLWVNELERKIVKLENKICATQLQIDDALEDISIVNRNVLNTYSIVMEVKEKTK
ncbi:MAG: hypothetical protein ACI4TK_17845 [Agathobacter sp.]